MALKELHDWLPLDDRLAVRGGLGAGPVHVGAVIMLSCITRANPAIAALAEGEVREKHALRVVRGGFGEKVEFPRRKPASILTLSTPQARIRGHEGLKKRQEDYLGMEQGSPLGRSHR